jgi:hypothetical protein
LTDGSGQRQTFNYGGFNRPKLVTNSRLIVNNGIALCSELYLDSSGNIDNKFETKIVDVRDRSRPSVTGAMNKSFTIFEKYNNYIIAKNHFTNNVEFYRIQ